MRTRELIYSNFDYYTTNPKPDHIKCQNVREMYRKKEEQNWRLIRYSFDRNRIQIFFVVGEKRTFWLNLTHAKHFFFAFKFDVMHAYRWTFWSFNGLSGFLIVFFSSLTFKILFELDSMQNNEWEIQIVIEYAELTWNLWNQKLARCCP